MLYRCNRCGAVMVSHAPLDGGSPAPLLKCCGEEIGPLVVTRDPAVIQSHKMDFVVFGGFEHNALRITIDDGLHPMQRGHRIEWVYLHTYQGGQLKYLPEGGLSVVNFALADEDAYVYCDRDVCLMGQEYCQFECKRGMIVYAYCTQHGLIELPLQGFRRRQ